ncbi:MAG: hypothetical protein FWC26_12335 [Fibromonadales bacterium]|nr:hypothetical protein [Fibromonadales bacterium]
MNKIKIAFLAIGLAFVVVFIISCSDGDGLNGKDGIDGTKGADGISGEDYNYQYKIQMTPYIRW